MYRGIFFDRDGVINKVILKGGKPFSPRKFSEFEILPEVEETLNILKKKGFINIIVTNQPDVARKLIEVEELNKMHAMLKLLLTIDEIMVCPHDDIDKCNCRKPKPGMLYDAARKYNINLKESYIVGDTWKDIEAGKKANCKTIIIDMPYNKGVKSDYRVKNIKDVLKIIK